MKRRSFIAGLLGLPAAPAIAKGIDGLEKFNLRAKELDVDSVLPASAPFNDEFSSCCAVTSGDSFLDRGYFATFSAGTDGDSSFS